MIEIAHAQGSTLVPNAVNARVDLSTFTPREFANLLTVVLEEAAARVYRVNVDNGWFTSERGVGDDIALLHSEVSEMFEAYREGGLEDQTNYTASGLSTYPPKPEGFGAESGDVLIRLLDTALRRQVDLGYEFGRKLEFNKTRGHRHGNKLI